MSVARRRRAAGAAVAAALVASGLAAVAVVAAPPATGVPATNTYLCEIGAIDEYDVPLTVDVLGLPDRVPVGVPVPGGWTVQATMELPDLLVEDLRADTSSIAGVTDELDLYLADWSPVPAALTSAVVALPAADGGLTLALSGTTGSFTPRDVGTGEVTMPDTFVLDLTGDAGAPLESAYCEIDDPDPGVIGTVEVVKQTSSVTGSAVRKPVEVGKRARVLVSVRDQSGNVATGYVVATLAGRTVGGGTLRNGTARLRLVRLPVGRHRVTLTYNGTKRVERSATKVTVKVVERRP